MKKYTVALTGGIGSGKSIVAKLFELYDIPVYDSDRMAKSLMETDRNLINEIIKLFGKQAYNGNKLHRPFLAEETAANQLFGSFGSDRRFSLLGLRTACRNGIVRVCRDIRKRLGATLRQDNCRHCPQTSAYEAGNEALGVVCL